MGRNYGRKDNPKTSDLAFIWDSENSDWRLATLQSVVDLYQNETNVLLEPDSQYPVPASSPFNIAVNDNSNDTHLFLNTAYTEGTILFPANTNIRDKQTLLITSVNAVTTLTLDANGASGIIDSITSIAAGGYVKYKYDLVSDTWYRVG